MQLAIRRYLPLVRKQPARLIAGRRFTQPHRRNFSSSNSTRLSVFPWGSNDPKASDGEQGKPQESAISHNDAECEVTEAKTTSRGGQVHGQGQKERSPNHGSAARRWMRNRRPKDIPPIVIPSWFLERNVRLREDDGPYTKGTLELTSSNTDTSHASPVSCVQERVQSVGEATGSQSTGQSKVEESQGDDAPGSQRTYRLNQALMGEVLALMSAGLSVSHAESAETFLSGKSHLRLHCPIDGGTYFLEKIVEEAAAQLQADVIRLDAQDLAEIAGSYIKEGPEASSNSLWSLGYDAQQIFPKPPAEAPVVEEEGLEGEAEDDADDIFDQPRPSRSSRQPKFTMTTVPLGSFDIGDPGSLMKTIKEQFEGRGMRGSRPLGPGNLSNGMVAFGQPLPNPAQQRNDFKLGALLEALCESNQLKRVDPVIRSNPDSPVHGHEAEPASSSLTSPKTQTLSTLQENTLSLAVTEAQQEGMKAQPPWPLPRTVLLIRGYKELSITHQGRLILEKLEYIVQKKRREGQQIILIGATASAELTPDISRNAFETIQSDGQNTQFRTMVVTPDEAGPAGGLYYRDTSRRMREINTRHLHDMTKRLSVSSARTVPEDLHEFATELEYGPEHASLSSMLEEQVLSFDEVHRIALTALGTQAANEVETQDKQSLRPDHIVAAMRLLDESDGIKTEWAKNEQQLQQRPDDPTQSNKTSAEDARLKKLRKTCNRHEKSLLRGVVNPENIRTTFKDVHAPTETIESLKNLTTLSLTRPEAFKYGVLATDKITGLLLYGPPGTGKTLLAKAVAKESGATVLEVSGSDVYDMYVGESEKNVRAIFTLARKLSPCVVFVDEADAIFASRGSGTNRTSHKELINQFLREWDGMTDTNAFIMVATNRPFDLDDAALRRLPRRLLVDLPVEKDREAILGIHLKEEALDPNVSLAQLAAQTPLYSGSDLKNLAVAAALTAVREENDAAAKHGETSEIPFTFPERRTLTPKHFEKAMEEITASVSDDMSSLGAIRKFDEQYGDRRGRKKKRGGYGFAGGEGVKEDAVKVRS